MSERNTILVAVGQDALAMALWRGLSARRDDLDVHMVRSEEAMAMLLEHARPTVVVLEVEDAGDESLARLRRVCAADSAPRVVVVSRDRSQRTDDALFAEGAETIQHMPADVPALVEAVATLLGAEETMAGQLGHIGVLDLVQMLCQARGSGAVRFRSPEGRGAVWLDNGEIVHAAWANAIGMDALVRLTVLESGTFRCFTGGPVPRRTIAEGWRQALMSAACLADEQRREAEGPSERPTADVVPVNGHAAARPWQTRYQELTELGLAAMRGGDLASARKHWNEAKLLQESHAEDEAREIETRPSRPTLRGFPASA